jgi:hypothetical protein
MQTIPFSDAVIVIGGLAIFGFAAIEFYFRRQFMKHF